MIRNRRIVGLLVFAASLAGLAGCDDGGGGDYVPVAGVVNFDGKALTQGTVVFEPDKTAGNSFLHASRGTIDAQGNYTLNCDDGNPGVPKGAYLIGVISTVPSNPKDEYAVPKSVIPTRYGDPKSSTLKVTVQPDASPESYKIDLQK